MKIILNGTKYLADAANAGLAEAWSESITDAMPIPDSMADRLVANYKSLCPDKPIFIIDAGTESIGRPISPERIEELRKQFVSSHTRWTT